MSKVIGAVDKPNERRVNKTDAFSWRFGYFHCFCGCHIIYPSANRACPTSIHSQPPGNGNGHHPIQLVSYLSYIWPFIVGGGIVVLTGLVDDIKKYHLK